MTIEHVNHLDADAFVATIGPIFEDSPWIAEAVVRRRPFVDRTDLLAAMLAVVDGAREEERVALIASHPDLAGRVAREGRLTPLSEREQASAGLATLTSDERARFDDLNASYRAEFGFPFVIFVREHTKTTILDAMQSRLGNDRETEIATALREIGKIARARLDDLVSG